MKTWEDTVIVECICDAYGHEPFHSPPNILGQEDKEWHHCYECDSFNSGKKAQAKATWEAASREIGEALCILVGNLMLKDMEKGKELGEQMRPLMELCQKNAGITFKIKEG